MPLFNSPLGPFASLVIRHHVLRSLASLTPLSLWLGIGAAGGEQTVAGTAVAHSWPVPDTAMALVTTNRWRKDPTI